MASDEEDVEQPEGGEEEEEDGEVGFRLSGAVPGLLKHSTDKG